MSIYSTFVHLHTMKNDTKSDNSHSAVDARRWGCKIPRCTYDSVNQTATLCNGHRMHNNVRSAAASRDQREFSLRTPLLPCARAYINTVRLPACTTDNGIAGMRVSLEKLRTPFPVTRTTRRLAFNYRQDLPSFYLQCAKEAQRPYKSRNIHTVYIGVFPLAEI